MVCSSGILCNNFETNLLGAGVAPLYNSTTLSWNWINSNGQTCLINQRGTGVGGFSFGLYDVSDNGYSPLNPYSEILTISANFNSSAGARVGRTYLQTPVYVYGPNSDIPNILGAFYSTSLSNGYYTEIQVGRGGGSYENALFAYNINTGTPQASFGEIDIAGAGTTITFNGSGNVGIGGAPSTIRLAVNGTVSKTGGSFLINHPDPLKPKWKLRHCFVESNTRGDNLYRYVITTSNQTGTVALPSYFKHLNENSQVFVSAKDNLGAGYGVLDESLDNLTINVTIDGVYNVLLIGTRKDQAMRDYWDQYGAEVPPTDQI